MDPADKAGRWTADSLPASVRSRLPAAYLVALECVAVGAPDAEIAARVGVDESAVGAVVRLATAKLLQVQTDLNREAAAPDDEPDDGAAAP